MATLDKYLVKRRRFEAAVDVDVRRREQQLKDATARNTALRRSHVAPSTLWHSLVRFKLTGLAPPNLQHHRRDVLINDLGSRNRILSKRDTSAAVEFDTAGNLLLASTPSGRVAVLRTQGDQGGDVVAFETNTGHSAKRARWDVHNDVQCAVCFSHQPEVWVMDLEYCDEDEPTASTLLQAGDSGVYDIAFVPGSVGQLVGAGSDGKLYVWDVRQGGRPTAIASHDGGQSRAVGKFGTKSKGASRNAPPGRVGGPRLAPVLRTSLSAVVPSKDGTVTTGDDAGQIGVFDLRKLQLGCLFASKTTAPLCKSLFTASSKSFTADYLPRSDKRAGIVDMLPSPHRPNTFICLLSSDALVEVDVEANVVLRLASPWSPPEETPVESMDTEAWYDRRLDTPLARPKWPNRHKRFCYDPMRRAVLSPWNNGGVDGLGVLQWDAHPFVVWQDRRYLTENGEEVAPLRRGEAEVVTDSAYGTRWKVKECSLLRDDPSATVRRHFAAEGVSSVAVNPISNHVALATGSSVSMLLST